MKIKPLTKEQIIISADRLTRFKEPEIKYLRVYKDIITNNLIEPKYKKTDLDEMDYEELTNYAQKIINYSLAEKFDDSLINQRLFDYENSIFQLDENTQKLLKNNINYKAIIKLLPEKIAANLKFLKALDTENPTAAREKDGFCFPVEKVVLCEGITEETLLPEFAKLCGYDFNKHGVYIVSAGGKNQVVKYFYNFADCLKIPVFVLLDKDAVENYNEIKPKLRKFDKIHILKSGEFEDILPDCLIAKTLNYETKNISLSSMEDLKTASSKAEFLEEFFKNRGLHDFKKSEFAHDVRVNITGMEDISEEINEIIQKIKGTVVPL